MRAVVSDRLFDRQLAADVARVQALKRAYEEKLLHMGVFVERLAQWKVFGTFTFRWVASVDSAKRCFERFIRARLPGNVSVFWVIEVHPGGHGAHAHALFDRTDWPRKEMWEAWFKRYGRARIEPLRSFRGREYCASKYVCKDTSWWSYRLSKQNFHLARRSSTTGGAELQGRTVSVSPEPVGDNLQESGSEGQSVVRQTAHSANFECDHPFAFADASVVTRDLM